MSTNKHHILADGRWRGFHGIGRFSSEILSRLNHTDILSHGPAPLSIKNIFWQSYQLTRKSPYRVFFNPGFNPIMFSSLPFVFTIHDLIPLRYKSTHANKRKKLYFEMLIKPTAKRARTVITVSEHSKREILEWTNLPHEKVVVAYCGTSPNFKPTGPRFEPGFPYLLHIGNTKEHKNTARLIQAFSAAKIDKSIKLIFTGSLADDMKAIICKYRLENQVQVHKKLDEETMASYYRGSLGVVFPSLCEGFGLPVVEGMASGVPVLTSNTTSLPEVAGDAALLINPYDTESITHGIEEIVNNSETRKKLIHAGPNRAKYYTWETSAKKIQGILDSV